MGAVTLTPAVPRPDRGGGNPANAKPARAGAVWPWASGCAILALAWFAPVPTLGPFAGHMVTHMALVALAAPCLALGLSRSFPAAVSRLPSALAMVAALIEFVAVWTWHAPALHDAARIDFSLFLLEQASFLGAGLLVWTSAIGAAGKRRSAARAVGVAALLVTSMHMTLLGALLLLSPRSLYACAHGCASAAASTPLADQQLGGTIMLLVGGIAYLTGGLICLAEILRDPSAPSEPS